MADLESSLEAMVALYNKGNYDGARAIGEELKYQGASNQLLENLVAGKSNVRAAAVVIKQNQQIAKNYELYEDSLEIDGVRNIVLGPDQPPLSQAAIDDLYTKTEFNSDVKGIGTNKQRINPATGEITSASVTKVPEVPVIKATPVQTSAVGTTEQRTQNNPPPGYNNWNEVTLDIRGDLERARENGDPALIDLFEKQLAVAEAKANNLSVVPTLPDATQIDATKSPYDVGQYSGEWAEDYLNPDGSIGKFDANELADYNRVDFSIEDNGERYQDYIAKGGTPENYSTVLAAKRRQDVQGERAAYDLDPVSPDDPLYYGLDADGDGIPDGQNVLVEDPAANPTPVSVNQAALDRLKNQPAIRAVRSPSSEGDWRVRLQMAPNASTLYKDPSNTLMSPLAVTDGVIFPYTPRIDISYLAEYNPYNPTHSNYSHYFYKGSRVGEINVSAEFTAQDTDEANYMLAVITFLKSSAKMYYGQDPDRGSPPPVLFLNGLGEFQFSELPVVVSQFNYLLPDDVDYIRAGTITGTADGTIQQRDYPETNSGPAWAGSTVRRFLSGLTQGAEPVAPPTALASIASPTYVPTKISINMQLLPVQSRREVSNDFSLRDYANGNLIKRGFW